MILSHDDKQMLGAVAVFMTVAAHVPYLVDTIRGRNKPHAFTWMIWSLLTGIAFAGQIVGHAGPGAWVTGVTSLICIIITGYALGQGEKNVTRSDRVMLCAALAALPVWWLTSNPLTAMLIVTGIDCAAFYPTFRKSWGAPHEENSFMYGFNVPRHAMTILALQRVSLTTAIYPAGLLAMNLVMYLMLKLRRILRQ